MILCPLPFRVLKACGNGTLSEGMVLAHNYNQNLKVIYEMEGYIMWYVKSPIPSDNTYIRAMTQFSPHIPIPPLHFWPHLRTTPQLIHKIQQNHNNILYKT